VSDASDSDHPRGRWPRLWAVWVVLALGSFFALEVPALVNDSGGDTLTEQIQWLGGYAPWAFTAGVVGFAVWLLDHFVAPDSRIWQYRRWRRSTDDVREDGTHDS